RVKSFPWLQSLHHPRGESIMLPNHAPLVIAEQFGTLETLHPGRIDLGLGRAPGTDQNTMRALRRSGAKADTFPEDVMELQAYLQGQSRIPGVNAYPGKGTDVPLYILGSSLFGAGLAATLGLPYAFASHFSPGALHEAIALYRREFQPSEQLEAPHVIAGFNVIAADDQADAERQQHEMMRSRVALLLQPGTEYTDEQADELLAAPQASHLHQMATYSAVGTPGVVRDKVTEFAEQTGADELIIAHQGPRVEQRLRSAELLAEAYLS
ncbi:MAG: MsnO8 family LLM class oxidoreductase, partial [Brachybacterium tyrofermentans]